LRCSRTSSSALLLLAAACTVEPPSRGTDPRGGGDTRTGGDTATTTPSDDDLPPPGDTDTGYPCGGPVEGTLARLWPEPGELYYQQIDLDGSLAIGEAALTVWPDGEIVVIDVGNDSHAATIRTALNQVIGEMNTRGFSARSNDTVDHIILTHHHSDHTDGLEDFLASVTVSGRVVLRGYYDLVGVNDGTIEKSCGTLAARAGLALPLCTGTAAPCDSAQWSGTYPPSGCSGTAANDLFAFGAETGILVLAVDGYIGDANYEDTYGPFLTENNGENARSLVGVLQHGPFRLLWNGDLTGGGSDTDPVEAFYVSHLASVSDLGGLGVDVLHAGHHGRNTSTSQTWADFLIPNDGKNRNVVMGISEAHYRSPYQEVLDVIFAANRLRDGRGWTTRIADLGQTHASLVDAAGGQIVIRTFDGGRGYYVQAIGGGGNVIATRRFDSVRTCP
jgi:beta-lactamase superfamily II metal-dependent hydrolase